MLHFFVFKKILLTICEQNRGDQ